jgi:hypothetical protein
MRVPLRMSAIDQEHLQELYDAAGVPRDDLPYTEQFEQIYVGFQDRTFKNADREQVYAALLKHVRSSSHPSKVSPPATLSPDQLKLLKSLLLRHGPGGRILPFSDEFTTAKAEFEKAATLTLSEREFWQATLHAAGARRRPPPPRARKAAVADADADVD